MALGVCKIQLPFARVNSKVQSGIINAIVPYAPLATGANQVFPFPVDGSNIFYFTVTSGNFQIPDVLGHVVVEVNKTTGSATIITGRANPNTRHWQIVKDVKGDAATNSITFVPTAGTVDGAVSHVISINKAAYTYAWDGTKYIIL
jgi:hypothetical protein